MCKAVELLLPRVQTLFEMGGENSKYIRFDRHGAEGRLGIADYQTNGDCAAGTGGFLDQQAGRLRFKVEEIGDIVLATKRAAQIAGRCSVFAKSDMIHAQQKGFTPEEILKGLCDAVARNFKSAITKGKKIVPEVCFVGGVASNRGVVQALESEFGWDPGTLIVPEDHAAFGAIGSAILAEETSRSGEPHDSRRSVWSACGGSRSRFPSSPRLSMENVVLLRNRMAALPPEEITAMRDAFLGIDIGSVSTNLVVIDAERNVLKEIYLRTDGRPIEVVSRGLREIERDLGGKIRIRGVGTTGSGRELIGELVGADTVNDEITAHKTGAAFIDRTILGLGVDTIFEIGGQDAKFISLEEGIVVDFAMNEACAAGTGQLPGRARQGTRHPDRKRFCPHRAVQRGADPARRTLHGVHGARRQQLPAARRLPGADRGRSRLLGGHQLHQPRRARTQDRRGDLFPGRNRLQRCRGGRLLLDPRQADHRAAVQRRHGRGWGRPAGPGQDAQQPGGKRLPRFRPRQGRLRDSRIYLQGLHEFLPDAAVHGRRGTDLLGRQVLGTLPQGGQSASTSR